MRDSLRTVDRRFVWNAYAEGDRQVTTSKLLAGVELGGTKCVCILGTSPKDVMARVRVSTGDPHTTLNEIDAVLERWRVEYGQLSAIGLASFGPICLDRSAAQYGYITSTPKAGWRDTEVATRFARRFDVPVGFDTDVNGAALAEGRLGAAIGLDDYAYITVGTGVGVGIIVRGRPVFGCNHAELGHLRVARAPDDHWPGACAYHGACVEGLASGHAIASRVGGSAKGLSSDHPAWHFAAEALGQLLHALVLATAPKRIILGGGVMAAQPHLFGRIRTALQRSLNGYITLRELNEGIDDYVVPASLGSDAGPVGALMLAEAEIK
jgi:fructokinase